MIIPEFVYHKTGVRDGAAFYRVYVGVQCVGHLKSMNLFYDKHAEAQTDYAVIENMITSQDKRFEFLRYGENYEQIARQWLEDSITDFFQRLHAKPMTKQARNIPDGAMATRILDEGYIHTESTEVCSFCNEGKVSSGCFIQIRTIGTPCCKNCFSLID